MPNLFHVPLDIVDIKPVNMEELTEVITAAEFHPLNCNNFMYSSSKGTIKLADMRDSALCDRYSKRTCEAFSRCSVSSYILLQNLRRRRTPPTDHSFRKSFPPSQM